jgi:hypothetical protein
MSAININTRILVASTCRYRPTVADRDVNAVQTPQALADYMGNVESNKLQMTCGVPQGSTLGPLLFLL